MVVRLDTNGTVIWQTVTGSTSRDFVVGGIAIDADDNSYIPGCTHGTDWPSANLDHAGFGQQPFLTKLDPARLVLYSKIFQPNQQGFGLDLALGAAGKVYVSGTAVRVSTNDWDAFVARFDDPGTGGWWRVST